MSLGTPKFQGKKPRNRGIFLTKKGSMVGRLMTPSHAKTILGAILGATPRIGGKQQQGFVPARVFFFFFFSLSLSLYRVLPGIEPICFLGSVLRNTF